MSPRRDTHHAELPAALPAAGIADVELRLGSDPAPTTGGKGMGKQALYAQLDLAQPQAYAYAVEVMAATSQTPDAAEGIAAFLEKRAPVWSG